MLQIKVVKLVLKQLLLEQYDIESMDSVLKDWFRSKEIMRKRYCKNEKLEYVRPAELSLLSNSTISTYIGCYKLKDIQLDLGFTPILV